MKDLLDIFLQPSPVLARQYDKPNGWLPMLVVAVVGALFSYRYFSTVDVGWFMRESIERSGEELSKAELDAVARSGDNPAFIWTSTIGALLASVVGLVLWAVYFLLAGKLTGLAVSFKQGLGLSGWASMPTVLGSLLALYGTVGMAPQTFISDLMLTSVDPMLVQLPPESPWKALASSFSFLNLWGIGLAALGWKLWSRDAGWTKPLVVAALPFVLIYGYQLIKALTV
ncbi:MAG: YIP1 family protein [Gammaproteobacteria bacterium]